MERANKPLTLEQLKQMNGRPVPTTQQPAHIDREKWVPCMWCALNGQFGLNNYCSNCGRPLTEQAWAELERRVFGG